MEAILAFIGQPPEGWEFLEYVTKILILLLAIKLTTGVIKTLLYQMYNLGR